MSEPESWQTNAAGPFLTIGEVTVWSLGQDRFRVLWPDGERHVQGYKLAMVVAAELAEQSE